jgi:DNA/RNA endonuclease G (NUC1)
VPEEVVRHFSRDKNDRLCLFTGPLFSQTDRWYSHRSLWGAREDTLSFWKMLVYIDAQSQPAPEPPAFLLIQDDQFLRTSGAVTKSTLGSYQVTTTEWRC